MQQKEIRTDKATSKDGSWKQGRREKEERLEKQQKERKEAIGKLMEEKTVRRDVEERTRNKHDTGVRKEENKSRAHAKKLNHFLIPPPHSPPSSLSPTQGKR